MRIMIACDSFKGSLSSSEAAAAIARGVLQVFPDAEIICLPVADGGEGTAQALTQALGGKLYQTAVSGPLGKKVEAAYGILPDGSAVIDMASASGLTLLSADQLDIMSASTYGTGELMLAALGQGCRRLYVGIGGSATNDGGLGMAQALGVRFFDEQGRLVEPGAGGRDLARISHVDMAALDSRILAAEIIVLCDVTNPLCGETGAAQIYGPQKGGSPEEIRLLDDGLARLADLVNACLGRDLAKAPGAGAAGGLGFGLMAFAKAKLYPGIDFLLTAAGFEGKLSQTDLVITGEGRLDGQSSFGKTPAGIARKAGEFGIPVVALAGSLARDLGNVYAAGIAAAEAAICSPMELAQAMAEAEDMVCAAAERLLRAIAVGMRLSARR